MTRVLIHPGWVDPGSFDGCERIEIDPSEPFAANALYAWRTVLYPAAFPKTRRRREARGIECVTMDVSGLAKAKDAVTCCSLLVEV